jgi:cystathionine beta-lyase/cystathionine gamma-synthase
MLKVQGSGPTLQHSTFKRQHFSRTPMKPATELIHHSDGASREAAPLTTPIYETTTFLFQDAAEVVAYNEAGRAEDCRTRGDRKRAGAFERSGGDDHGADGADGVR